MAVLGYMYSGSGYQYVGLGRKIYDHMWGLRQFYDKIEKLFPDFKINKLSFIGPPEELMKEENGILISAIYQAGVYEVLKEKKILPEQIMGYKAGEIAALFSAEMMTFEDTMLLLKKKIDYTKEELDSEKFYHLLVNGIGTEKVMHVASELNKKVRTEIVSYNAPDSNTVICERSVKDKLIAVFKRMEGKIIELPYEELSNFSLLEGVAEKMKNEMNEVQVDRPIHRMICQTTGDYYDNTAEIKEKAFDYIYKPAQVGKIMQNMLKNGVNTFVEMGAGNFLYRMAKKADKDKRVLNTNDLGQISITIKLAN